MHFRKIVVLNKEYQYHIGTTKVVLVYPDGAKKILPFIDFGFTSDEIERGRWKKYTTLTPRDIANYIERTE